MFGLIVIGNVVDNVSQPKWVAIFLQVALGTTWIITGFLVHYGDHEKPDTKRSFLNNLMIAQLFGSGVVIINILQISNWFT